MKLIMKGRCWKFGDNLGIDSAVMPLRLTRELGHDPKVLKKFVMAGVDPEFHKNVRRGDIIVAGKRFGHGNPHIFGYFAIKELGIGLVVESIARGAYRNAVTAGLPFLPNAEDITEKVKEGDELEVNFKTGEIKDLTTGESIKTEPLPEFILEIIEAGGQEGYLRKKLAPK